MHERTRRNLCRLAFLALGVLPTVYTLAWSGYRASPIYAASERSSWERQLFERTGLTARISRVEHPAGGSTLLHSLELSDPDGGDRVAAIRQVEIAYQPQGIVVLLSQPEIAQGQFLRIWDVLHQRVLQGPTPSAAIQITSGELTLEVGRDPQTFTSVRCTVEPMATGVTTRIDFQLAGVGMPTPAQLRIHRNRQTRPATTEWRLHTETEIPCATFTDYLRPLMRLGDRAVFQGKVSCFLDRDACSGEIVGRFTQVDLSQLTESLPHKLSGLATLTLDHAVVEQGVLVSATGSVESQGGTVSRSLVAALAQQVPLAAPDVQLATHAPLMPYDRLAFQFAISGEGFSLAGLDPNASDVILIAEGEPLLTGNRRAVYPLVSLVRALAPDSQFLVPATSATKDLLQWLEIPEPRPRVMAQEPQAPRLRLSGRSSK